MIRFISNREYGWLSNFSPSPIKDPVNPEKIWPTVEHLFQAAKTLNRGEQEKIRKAKSPREAKVLGHTVTLRKDWEDIKIGVMRGILELKFDQNPELKQKLLDTGTEPIEEDMRRDSFWGTGQGNGKNWMGRLLMELRGKYRAELRRNRVETDS